MCSAQIDYLRQKHQDRSAVLSQKHPDRSAVLCQKQPDRSAVLCQKQPDRSAVLFFLLVVFLTAPLVTLASSHESQVASSLHRVIMFLSGEGECMVGIFIIY